MKLVLTLASLLLVATAAYAEDPHIDYARDIKPVLRERCYACHGALKQNGGLRLDTVAVMRTGGDGGKAFVSGEPQNSLILERISDPEPASRMPPEGHPLTAEQIAKITIWIQQGAKSSENEQSEIDPREHWAFKRPIRPMVPASPAAASLPIDAFIQGPRQSLSITPLPPANKATLLRRVYLDLIGLPPTADELHAFISDDSPLAYESVVDQLLASPQHGERWGRHWMDVWRYSDWYGRRSVPDVMNSYPMMWRWRDWIVQSINADKGYDRMVVEMLAADEMDPADDANIVATGYLVRSWFKWNYETWKKDLVEHTGKAFLGITLNCAQCHDHKFDPFKQEEYFRFRAFFEPLELRQDRVVGEPDPGPFEKYIYGKAYGPIKSGMVRVFDEQLDAQTFMFAKGDSRLRMEGKPPVTPAAPAVLGGDQIILSPINLPAVAAYPGLKPFIQAEERAVRQAKLAVAEAALVQARTTESTPPAGVKEELLAAEAALTAARQNAVTAQSNGLSPVLAGDQSLLLDAKTGRRALSHGLLGIDDLAESAVLSYLVRIVQDEHTNLQLALDIEKGATGAWVGFEKGTIKSYAPGGFNEIIAGKYDLAKGQDRFKVVMQFELSHDRFLLTVLSLTDNQVLANAVPAALNGWQPKPNGKRGLFIDCRPGTVALYDDLKFTQPDGKALLIFDFESSAYLDGHDVQNVRGWTNTPFSQTPATSVVSSAMSLDPQVRAAVTRVASAQQVLRGHSLKVSAATALVKATQLELVSLESRCEADIARYAGGTLAADRAAEPVIMALIHKACQDDRDAAIALAQANQDAADVALADAAAQSANAKEKPAIDAAATAFQSAQQQRATASNALTAATAIRSKPLGEYTPLSLKYPATTTGRRTALARWITDRQNPLTARVAVNHIWLRHFGQALVKTPHDLGRNGSLPTHPELLDWLACELMDSGWSMKHIHRLIVTSDTYRMASAMPISSDSPAEQVAAALQADLENRTYWRFPPLRMEAEVVRDSLLALSGELDSEMGGPELDHQLGLTSRRRSLYFAHHGEEKMEFLELFDAANANDCYKRSSSIQPQQALALSNSELTRSLSRLLAQRLWSRVPNSVAATPENTTEFVKLAFLQILNRDPRKLELELSLAFLRQQATQLTQLGAATANLDSAVRARENLIHALMNHNDFVTIR